MQTESQRIEHDIDRRRGELGADLEALHGKFRDATDWRTQFDRHPWVMVSAAAGAGFLVSRLFSGGSREGQNSERGMRARRKQNRALETFDSIKAALLASAATQVRSFFSDVIPSFREHYDSAERSTDRKSVV